MFLLQDLWVLDVEGGEMSVLLGTDFRRLSVSVILIETMHNDSPLKHLVQQGYTCVRVNNNNVCTHRSFQPSRHPSGHVPPLLGNNRIAYSKSLKVVYN